MNDKIEIKPYEYNSMCEVAGCRNLGKKTLAKPVANGYQKLIICDNCIAEIVEAAPKEVLLKLVSENKEIQKDIVNVLDEEIIINKALELTQEEAEDEGVINAIKGEENGESNEENGENATKKSKSKKDE